MNPILRDAGVRRPSRVPVYGPDGLLGVLHIGSLSERSFGAATWHGWKGSRLRIGQRTFGAAQERCPSRCARASAEPATRGASLHRGARPGRCATCPPRAISAAIGTTSSYFPAARSDSSWATSKATAFDPQSSWDVCAAPLRAYALEHEDPAEVLGPTGSQAVSLRVRDHCDRHLCRDRASLRHPAHLHRRAPTTAVAGSGQHEAHEAQVPPGLILGVDPSRQRHSHELFLGQGAALVFYTDGLVERPGTISASHPAWRERLDLVCRAFRSDQDAETICSRIIAAGLGDDSVEDDVAVIAMRRMP